MPKNLFDSGIRPIIDEHLAALAAEKRDYGEYWSASSAGYCMRKVIFERLGVPHTSDDPRKQRVFSAGDVFHEWIQRITEESGKSMHQELEVQDDTLMIRGHIDDIVMLKDGQILYDYKSTHSKSFNYAKDRPMSHYHRMQVGTYLYLYRKFDPDTKLKEARVLRISKDDLRMHEDQLLYTPTLEKEVVGYWKTLNGYWQRQKLPKCTCELFEGGFMAREKWNPFYYKGEPCSLEWYAKYKEKLCPNHQ